MRHRLVKEIIKAYDIDDEYQKARKEAEKAAKAAGENLATPVAVTPPPAPVEVTTSTEVKDETPKTE